MRTNEEKEIGEREKTKEIGEQKIGACLKKGCVCWCGDRDGD